MDDEYDHHDAADGDRMRAALRHVADYRELCAKVRKSGGKSLVFGGVMLFFWYQMFYGTAEQESVLSALHLGLAVLELGAGVVNRFLPSAEGVLFDGLVLAAFGGANLYRQYLASQGLVPNVPRGPNWVFIAFGVYWLLQGVRHVRGYAALRGKFAERPSATHVRWFDDLLREVRASDPESDPQALDLPTKPRLKAKLLGDTALFLVPGSGEVGRCGCGRRPPSCRRGPRGSPRSCRG